MDTEKTSRGPVNSGPVLPLAMLGEGETALIVTVKGASDLRQHLFTLGFVEGALAVIRGGRGGHGSLLH